MARAGTWLSQTADGASGGTYLYSTGSEADVLTLVFSGTTIEIVYLAGPHLGTLALEVDDTVLRTVITTAEQTAYQQTTTLNYLTDEPHTLRVYAQEGGIVAVDAFVARLPVVDGLNREGLLTSTPRLVASDYEIAYNCDGNDICLRTPDKNDPPIQITNDDRYIAPEWSPDGRQILYHRDEGTDSSAFGILERDANDVWDDQGLFARTPTATSVSSHKSWSPDGTKILYGGDDDKLYVIDIPQCRMAFSSPTPPPFSDCYSYYVTTNNVLPEDDLYRDPSWAPDSSRFVFRYRDGNRDYIYTANLVLSGQGTTGSAIATDLINQTDYDFSFNKNYSTPTWSPDGTRIVTSFHQSGVQSLVKLNGSDPGTYITGGNNDYSASWSPDGIQLVYVHGDSLPTQLYIVPESGGTPTPLGPGSEPSWRRQTRACVIDIPSKAIPFYRAPITYNYLEGYLEFASEYDFLLDFKFIDHLSTTWYRVSAVLRNGQVVLPSEFGDPVQQAIIMAMQQRGGLWVEADTLPPTHSSDSGGINCDSPDDELGDLPIANKYDIPQISWTSFAFTRLPLNPADICAASSDLLHIPALGVDEPKDELGNPTATYPKDRHHGVDLFVSQAQGLDVLVTSVGTGIVVGIAKGMEYGIFEPDSHGVWDAFNVTEADGSTTPDAPDVRGEYGYSVIVRYGHLYVLYGHLQWPDDNIWVGAQVTAGEPIGILGRGGENRHLHIEVRRHVAYSGLHPTGIISFKNADEASYFYDFMQFLDYPPGYIPPPDNQSLATSIATINLPDPNPKNRSVDLNLGCTITYQTQFYETEDAVLKEADGYRGFLDPDTAATPPVPPLPSPIVVPSDVPQEN